MLATEGIINKYGNKSAEELQRTINTAKKAHGYVKAEYGPKSFCLNAAKAIAYLIADDNYNPEIILLEKENYPMQKVHWEHWICVFQKNGKYGFADNGVFGYSSAKYNSVDSLVKDLAKKKKISRGYRYTEEIPFEKSYCDAKGLEKVLESLNRDKRLNSLMLYSHP